MALNKDVHLNLSLLSFPVLIRLQMPQNESDWKLLARQFKDRWDYPNCCGAFDGKHIEIQAPDNSGTEFFNYHGFFSIVLFAVVDANYNFVYANVGCQGRISDGGVFSETNFKKCLDDNTMHLPRPSPLPGRNTCTPFVFVADDAFPLSNNVMKPFPGAQDKGSPKRVFNYRLSRARRVAENAFGIICSVFRVLRKPMILEPQVAQQVTLAILFLHNFLRNGASRAIYNPVGMLDTDCIATNESHPGLWRQAPATGGLLNIPRMPRRSSVDAQSVRNDFVEYFVSPEGKVAFQENR